MDSTTAHRLRAIVASHLGIDEALIHAGAEFKDDLGADSIDIIDLAMTIEDELHISITDDEVNACMGEGTFGNLEELVAAKLASKREAAHG